MDYSAQLRNRGVIQERTRTAAPMGSNFAAWSEREKRWCAIVPVSERFQLLFQQEANTRVTHKIVFRGAVSLAPDLNRIVLGSTNYMVAAPPRKEHFGHYTSVLVREEC